ncbi:MAG: nuclear transport factor 2 family protein [Clostridiales Family XIII bacterium]|nr:nuclear transport factor 2 family protein [Clostridiales Family XIII bacterium]
MDTTNDATQIRDLIERWVVYRDAFLWDKFRKVWHPEGVMIATWSQSSYEDFIKNTEYGKKEHGLWYMHILGGSGIEVNGDRGVSMTKMIITQRIELDGVLCDMNNFARHFDFWEKRDGRWGLLRRETICDKDTLAPVYPDEAAKLKLDRSILEKYPQEYRYLAYCAVYNGYGVSGDVPRYSGGSALENLYRRGDDWLSGKLANPNAPG